MVAVAEDQLQAVALAIQLDQTNPRINLHCQPLQPKGPALRARALAAQFGVIEQLFAAIRPVQP